MPPAPDRQDPRGSGRGGLDRPGPDSGHNPVGVVPAGRGVLPDALLYGEPLVAHATRALAAAGVEVAAADTPWATLAGRGVPVVVHDPLCPLTPPGFIAELVEAATASGAVVVGVRPVTDTIKVASGGVVGETVDREQLVTVTSPVVLPAAVVAALGRSPDLTDLAALVAGLRARFPTTLTEAPSLGRRVDDETGVLLLAAFAELHPGR